MEGEGRVTLSAAETFEDQPAVARAEGRAHACRAAHRSTQRGRRVGSGIGHSRGRSNSWACSDGEGAGVRLLGGGTKKGKVGGKGVVRLPLSPLLNHRCVALSVALLLAGLSMLSVNPSCSSVSRTEALGGGGRGEAEGTKEGIEGETATTNLTTNPSDHTDLLPNSMIPRFLPPLASPSPLL